MAHGPGLLWSDVWWFLLDDDSEFWVYSEFTRFVPNNVFLPMTYQICSQQHVFTQISYHISYIWIIYHISYSWPDLFPTIFTIILFNRFVPNNMFLPGYLPDLFPTTFFTILFTRFVPNNMFFTILFTRFVPNNFFLPDYLPDLFPRICFSRVCNAGFNIVLNHNFGPPQRRAFIEDSGRFKLYIMNIDGRWLLKLLEWKPTDCHDFCTAWTRSLFAGWAAEQFEGIDTCGFPCLLLELLLAYTI